MLTPLLAAALALQSAPGPAPALAPATSEPAPLSQEDRALLRCAAAFAILADGQAKGNAAAQKWPPIEARGREFFVRVLAQVMDRTGLDRDGISRLISAEAQALWDSQETEKVIPSCLVLLESSGI
ncbi:hypothetical protein FHS52_000300 [Erythromicrobium ramosum]|uniref:Uncharacterized protein n=1 Tax=Erythrobacter ramosus TaxID=35811 RepID=A0A6I4UKR7_9SPHN|nr:hypothetical protein [Erythrobacter ramosus]MBB3774357.1 hypothetical protein [Erythrobacter ramosus]MXP37989.1 hypothetical protein [Erythrobacter ramosus]